MISVVIPFYNESGSLRDCLEAFLEQTYPGDFELILVDNGSTDDSRERVHAFSQTHRGLALRVVPEARRGVAFASQAGFAAARYPLIARTDADTIVGADWLSAIAKRFQDKRVVALCGHVGFREPTLLQRWLFLESLIEFHQRLHILIRKPHFWGFNFAVRKEVFLRAGGFNTQLRIAEDLDLGLRIQQALQQGERIVYAPEMRVYSSSRRYGLNRRWLRYTIEGYRAYFQRAWLGRTASWMCLQDRSSQSCIGKRE
jgi:glycosyltransferase involved in cell wall biosynthesis